MDLAPDLPTFREQGYDIELSSLRGLAAPKGLPADIRERWVRAVERVCKDPEFLRQAAQFYAPMRYLAPEPYAVVLREGQTQLRQLWTEMPWGDK
jgi:tripartite-type tricarboxylate transporter receptor subunit TctC